MSIHVRQLEQYFVNSLSNHIDVLDLKGRPASELLQAQLSRSLAAFSVMGLTGASIADACKSVVDGTRDQGIDGVFVDAAKNALIFVQSKWNSSGTKTISKGDLLKFLHGIKLVLAADWAKFSPKMKARQKDIESLLLTPDVSVIAVVAFSGDNELSIECREVLQAFELEQNSVSDFFESRVIDLRALHRFLRTATLASQAPFNAMLLDWGQTQEPYQAVYGRINCEELAKLYESVGQNLFEPNIRSFLGDGEVNNQISATLLTRPEDFWYLNNGITAICTRYSKTALGGGDNRIAGTFVFEGIQIVNGAQTIGSIAKSYKKNPTKVSRAFASIKVVSLEGTPLGFTDTVTLASNKQNRVEEKDFLALDANQSRVKAELQTSGIQYVFRSGETIANRLSGLDASEAMVGLACSSSAVANAVLAKRNIGLLLDRSSSSYQALFHSGISGQTIWRSTQQQRRIDAALGELQKAATSQRKKQLLTHGNRIISWVAFNTVDVAALDDFALRHHLELLINSAHNFIQEIYPDSYLAVFFKNTQKCDELTTEVIKGLGKS